VTIEINKNGVQIVAVAPTGGKGWFPLFARQCVVRSLRNSPRNLKCALAWQREARIL
jgi:hypothetical protein